MINYLLITVCEIKPNNLYNNMGSIVILYSVLIKRTMIGNGLILFCFLHLITTGIINFQPNTIKMQHNKYD